ncbi:MAG TPA: amidase [Actinospica sp.]|nr:amidase [Actinospica sp.]
MSDPTGDDLCYTPATELAALIRRRELSPVELVDALLDRIERVEPTVNAYVTLLADQARADAKRAAQEVVRTPAERLGALHGVPVSIKDLTPTKGVRTTYGSAALSDYVPDEDGLIVTRIRQAGAILLGKTTTPEFGLHSVTESALTGVTRNPWNPERTVGGSSGGAAAAVAAGISPLATGSDGGGSIRVPAAMCGVVGLKASPGRIPNSSEASAYDTVSVVGPITRTVADNALLADVMSGYDPYQPFSIPGEPGFGAALAGATVKGLRIGYSPDLGNAPVEPEVARLVEEAVRDLEAAGAIVERIEIELPDPLDYFMKFWGPLAVAEIEEFGLPHEALPAHIVELLEKTAELSAADHVRIAYGARSAIRAAFATVFDGFDLMVWPTTKMAAYPHVGDRGGPAEIAGVPVGAHDGWSEVAVRSLQNQLYTEAVAHAGYPAVSAPAGLTAEGLPVGIQIAAGQYEDAAVLRAAAALEEVRPWSQLRPTF